MATYFGFAIADSMFPAEALIKKAKVDVSESKSEIEGAIPCLNPSHIATIEALNSRFGL